MGYPFTNRIVQQLISPPAVSRAALGEASRGRVPVAPKGAAFPAVQARSWLDAILQPRFRPAATVPFLAFPAEAGLCDVVRASYQVDGVTVETAQSRHLLVLQIAGAAPGGGDFPLESAEAFARQLFERAGDIYLVRTGTEAGRTQGKQDVESHGSLSPGWPHWIDSLHWWVSGPAIGFVMLKATGGGTREVIGPSESLNVRWFEKE
jgi:hypothetical protein